MNITPGSRPQLTRDDAAKILSAHGVKGPAILGIRGYYLDSMGEKGKNDIGIYDDAIAIVAPTVYRTFNGNTDPSKDHKGVAILQPGTWEYMRGIHNLSKDPATHPHYPALVQAAPVVVFRENTDEYETGHVDAQYGKCLGAGRWVGDFAIHIHHGSYTTTSSEGCQTIHPDQWPEFWSLIDSQMMALGLSQIPYCLTVNQAAA